MKWICFILNLPFTLTGIVPLLVSIPYKISFINDPIAIIFKVRSFWWFKWYLKKVRAVTIGHIVMLGPRELKNDFEHEIIHVRQTQRHPFIFPFLYFYQSLRHGYRNNRFEDEAYRESNSVYEGGHG